MVTIKVPGNKDVELTSHQFLEMINALKCMVLWNKNGMYGDEEKITNMVGFIRAKNVLEKLGY